MFSFVVVVALLAVFVLCRQNMVDTAVALPTRFDPAGAAPPGSPPLEFVHWPLYSAIALDAAAVPREIQAFNYTRGQNVTGAGAGVIASTMMHTNMEVPSAVPGPRIFVVHGIRIVIPPLAIGATPALSDPGFGGANENNDQVDDLTMLYQVFSIEFKIGTKLYAQAPVWMMPANVGVGGLAATAVNADPDGASVNFTSRVAMHTAGRGYSFAQGKKPVLWNTQPFLFRFLCEWTTNPTVIDNRLVYAIFDGVYGREIQ